MSWQPGMERHDLHFKASWPPSRQSGLFGRSSSSTPSSPRPWAGAYEHIMGVFTLLAGRLGLQNHGNVAETDEDEQEGAVFDPPPSDTSGSQPSVGRFLGSIEICII